STRPSRAKGDRGMARIVVVGAGVGGLGTAMLLAQDGHEVTVLERDSEEPPASAEEAWSDWERRGVNQFRLLHLFAPRFRAIVETELPSVEQHVEDFGALRLNTVTAAPEEFSGGVRPGDKQFEML